MYHIKKPKFLFIAICVFCFLLLPATAVFALVLEVDYPETIVGTTISGSSGLPQYLKWIFEASISIGLFAVVATMLVAGVFYFLSPLPGSTSRAKDMFSSSLTGFLIIVLTYLIVKTINPALLEFNLDPLQQTGSPSVNQNTYGLKIYRSTGCDQEVQFYTSDVNDFKDLKNRIKSVKIDQNVPADTYYVSLLYDNTNNWGKCQYIDPNSGCQTTSVSVASATVYEYDFSPSGSGITIYRNAFGKVSGKGANKDNGYLKIKQNDIGGLYWQELKNLSFTGESIRSPDITTSPNDNSSCTVPYPERDCVKWSDAGLCVARRCPMLDKEGISSIELNGNYLVVLIYIDPTDDTDRFTYSYCQAFPIRDDVNRYGPQQLKWDAIRSSGREPNYILIIPVKYR